MWVELGVSDSLFYVLRFATWFDKRPKDLSNTKRRMDLGTLEVTFTIPSVTYIDRVWLKPYTVKETSLTLVNCLLPIYLGSIALD